MAYPDHQNADFFTAILPFLAECPDLEWLLALTCTASKTALAGYHPAGYRVTTRYRSVLTSPERCALAIECGCAPAPLYYAAAAGGNTAILDNLYAAFPAELPTDLVKKTDMWRCPRTISAVVRWAHTRGLPIKGLCLLSEWRTPELLNYLVGAADIKVDDWDAGYILGHRTHEFVLEVYAPGAPLTSLFPAGPKDWAMETFHSNEVRDTLAIIRHCYALGWDMKSVPYYVVKYDHLDILDWLGSEGILDILLEDLDAVSVLCDTAYHRGSRTSRDWLDAYFEIRVGEIRAREPMATCMPILPYLQPNVGRLLTAYMCTDCRKALEPFRTSLPIRTEEGPAGPLTVPPPCRSAATTPAETEQVVGAGYDPKRLIVAAALIGDAAALDRLCTAYPDSVPCSLVSWVLYGGSLEAVQWAHEHGYPFTADRYTTPFLTTEVLNYLVGAGGLKLTDDDVCDIILYGYGVPDLAALFAGTSPLAKEYPEGPTGWACALFRSRHPGWAFVSYAKGLGWDMSDVPYYAIRYGMDGPDDLQWLETPEGGDILAGLDLYDVDGLRQAAEDRHDDYKQEEIAAWVEAYYNTRVEAAQGESPEAACGEAPGPAQCELPEAAQ